MSDTDSVDEISEEESIEANEQPTDEGTEEEVGDDEGKENGEDATSGMEIRIRHHGQHNNTVLTISSDHVAIEVDEEETAAGQVEDALVDNEEEELPLQGEPPLQGSQEQPLSQGTIGDALVNNEEEELPLQGEPPLQGSQEQPLFQGTIGDAIVNHEEEELSLQGEPPLQGPQEQPLLHGTICKVPPRVGEVEKQDYRPSTVGIGPFHYQISDLEAMESQKDRLLAQVLNRSRRRNLTLQTIKDAMRIQEKRTRGRYSEEFQHISSEDFVMMMVRDGCFVVELLRIYGRICKGDPVRDEILNTRWKLAYLRRDLLIQDNQLPLFVLQKIFRLTASGPEESTSLNRLALQFFEPLRSGIGEMPSRDFEMVGGNYLHLLAVFHSSFLNTDSGHPLRTQQRRNDPPPQAQRRRRQQSIGLLPPQEQSLDQFKIGIVSRKDWVPNAQTLINSCISLKKNSGKSLEIVFKNQRLEIPAITIDEETSFVLKHLLSYEACNSHVKPYFSPLVAFLTSIVISARDVILLRQRGILRNAQTREDGQQVIDFFTNLSKGLIFDPENCYISNQVKDINVYSKSPSAWLYQAIFTVFKPQILLGIILTYLSFVLTITFHRFRI